jgi:hypothetical protein
MKIEKMDVMPENTPPSIAAGVVYYISQICKLNISKRDVKNVSETRYTKGDLKQTKTPLAAFTRYVCSEDPPKAVQVNQSNLLMRYPFSSRYKRKGGCGGYNKMFWSTFTHISLK